EAHEPSTAERLAVLELTDPAPALPYITAPRFAALAPRLVAALDAAAPLLPEGDQPLELVRGLALRGLGRAAEAAAALKAASEGGSSFLSGLAGTAGEKK
ncbi:MAG: hypothetical protein RQ748_08040, partial [Elusimicrobiales bacterium]|nr:hypothetical protein [Elusimicrobiales bacterium]